MSIINILKENNNYKFICDGDFFCYMNEIKSLIGSPKYVGGNFYCSFNNIVSLEGSPKIVDGNFSCHRNKLTSLEGAPEYVGRDFDCRYNSDLPKEEILKYYNKNSVAGRIFSDYGEFK